MSYLSPTDHRAWAALHRIGQKVQPPTHRPHAEIIGILVLIALLNVFMWVFFQPALRALERMQPVAESAR